MDSYQDLNLAYSSFMGGQSEFGVGEHIPPTPATSTETNGIRRLLSRDASMDEICCDLFDFEIPETCDISFAVNSSGQSIIKEVFNSDKSDISRVPRVGDILISVNGIMIRDSYHAESILDAVNDHDILTLRIKRENSSSFPCTNVAPRDAHYPIIEPNFRASVGTAVVVTGAPRAPTSLEHFRTEFLNLAMSAHSRGLHRCAHSCATQALKICRLIPNSKTQIAQVHFLMSSICDKMGLTTKALGHAKITAKIAQEYPSENIDLIGAFERIGQIFRKLKMFENSLDFYSRALRLAQLASAESIESDKEETIRAHLVSIASIFSSLGKVYRLQGISLSLALDCEEQALQYYSRAKCSNVNEDVVLCHISILLINAMQGDLEYEASLKMTTTIRIFEQGQCAQTLRAASIYRCAATFFELQSDWGTAIHLKSEEIRVRETFDCNSVSLASALWKIGMYQLAAGELEMSIPFRKRAIDLLTYIFGPDHSKVKKYRARNDKVGELLSCPSIITPPKEHSKPVLLTSCSLPELPIKPMYHSK